MYPGSSLSSTGRSSASRMRTPAVLDNGVVSQSAGKRDASFGQGSHTFLQHSAALEQIAARLEHRTVQRDETTQIAVKAADADAQMALDAARYFRDVATVQTNQSAALQT